MLVGKCSQCGGIVYMDMEGNLRCSKCGAFKSALPIIKMPNPHKPNYPDILLPKSDIPWPKYPYWENPYKWHYNM